MCDIRRIHMDHESCFTSEMSKYFLSVYLYKVICMECDKLYVIIHGLVLYKMAVL
jgi:hypothetical protein